MHKAQTLESVSIQIPYSPIIKNAILKYYTKNIAYSILHVG